MPAQRPLAPEFALVHKPVAVIMVIPSNATTELLPSIGVTELRRALGHLLSELRARQDGLVGVGGDAWITRLFSLIGWSEGGAARLRRVGSVREAVLWQCELFDFPAFQIIASPDSDSQTWQSRVESALTWLYSQGHEWVVVANEEFLTILNVHWTDRQTRYLPFRSFRVSALVENADTLALLTPRRILQRDLFEQGAAEAPRRRFDRAKVGEPTIRPRIDQAILNAAQFSRNLFLSSPPPGEIDAQEYDERIHQLLLRLIFVRACEDMSLGIARPLRQILAAPDIQVELGEVLERYRSLYESELFASLDLSRFDGSCLRAAIESLYRYSDIVEFNFAAIEADILGMIYEEYLKFRAVRKVRESEDGEQVFFFDLERIRTENIKRKQGIYYTPSFLVESIVEQGLELLNAPEGIMPNGAPVTIADLACGSGTFLAAAFRRLGAHSVGYQSAARVLQRCVYGIDTDRRAVEATRLNLWLTLFRLHPEVHPLPYLARSVFARDSLIGPLVEEPTAQSDMLECVGSGDDVLRLPTRPDLIVGNPPFVSRQQIPLAYRQALVREGFESLEGRADLANLFVERALRTVREGGVVALVVPNRIFTTLSASALRCVVRRQARIEKIVDFGTIQLFDATTYVAIVFLRKVSKDVGQRAVSVTRFHKLTEPAELHVREAMSVPRQTAGSDAFLASLPESRDAPIYFLSPQLDRVLRKLRSVSERLDSIADTRQGIRVGEQGAYVFAEAAPEMQVEDPHLIRLNSIFKVPGRAPFSVLIERDILRRAVHSKSIQRYRRPQRGHWIIYPYDSNGSLIPFAELKERFPRAGEHLERFRKVGQDVDTWHALARPRDQRWLRRAKLVCPQLAKWGRMTLDSEGRYLIQGYAVLPRESSPLTATAILAAVNSTPVVWSLAMSAPRYQGDSFEYQRQSIDSLPIPHRLLTDKGLARSVNDAAERLIRAYASPPLSESSVDIARCEAEVDALIYVALGLKSQEVEAIEEEAQAYRPSFDVATTHRAIALSLDRMGMVPHD